MNSAIDIPQRKTLADAGLDSFGQSPLVFSGIEENKKALSIYKDSLTPSSIQSGDFTQNFVMTDGYIQSADFVTGVSGWRIHSDGTSEFN